jgi:diguanylate cyclase (GGDEF)-like protein
MTTERSMIKIRWLALASALAFFAILNVPQMRGLLVLVAIGVVYNLMLSSARQPDVPERFKTLSTLIDLAGLSLIIFFTGGVNSIFVVYLAVYLFALALRHGPGAGVTASLLASAGLSYYYFINPTAATQSLVLTRVVLFVLAPLGAFILKSTNGEQVRHVAESVAAPAIEPVSVVEPAPDKAAAAPVAPPAAAVRAPEPEPAVAVVDPVASHPIEPAVAPVAEAEVVSPVATEPAAPVPPPVVAPVEPVIERAAPSMQHPVAEARPVEVAPAPASLADEIAVVGEELTDLPGPETKALKEKITELAILHEASKALGATLVLEEVVDAIVDITAKGLLADIAGALIYDDKTGLMTVAGLRGFTAEEREVINSTAFAPGEGILGEAFAKKKTFNLADLSAERPGASPFNGRIKSFLVTPLATDGFDIGVLFLGKYVMQPFSLSSEEFLETMAGQAAIAVENAKLYTQAQELAIHDGLTGIYNYRYFMKQLEEELRRAERYGRSVSVAMIDIDLFKHVNDSYGHQRGDDVLRGLVQTLTTNTRDTDIVARYGGEEFVVILPETDLADALDVAEKLRAAVAKASYAREKGHSIKITISLGVAAYPSVAGNQEDLLRKADDALYSAKTKRNVVVSAGAEHRQPS